MSTYSRSAGISGPRPRIGRLTDGHRSDFPQTAGHGGHSDRVLAALADEAEPRHRLRQTGLSYSIGADSMRIGRWQKRLGSCRTKLRR